MHTPYEVIVKADAFSDLLQRYEQAPDITDVHVAEVSLAIFDQLFGHSEVIQ